MALRDEIEDYANSLLPSDPHDWCRKHSTPKIIHDALWGTFELAPHEVALLDTPLLQRLRFLHQTGAVHLTYPSARHTRFEHVLGVMYQAGRMCTALRARGRGRASYYKEDDRFNIQTEYQARFTALVHDIGHGPFSHTSEQYFSAYDDMAEVKREKYFHDSGAGEVLSCLIVQSSKFRSFVRAINDVYGLNIEVETTANMITGNMDDAHMYLSEIVHGPFDADKLDYMHRDGMFSGLKMHVDLDRLYTSIHVLASDIVGREKPMTRLAGSMAGTSPLTQIMFNKMLLFTGIYHHHKVRSVDCMLWAIFELALTRHKTIGGREINSTVDFLNLTDDRVLIPELTNDEDIRKLIEDIRNRRLWRRALVISRHTVPVNMHDPQSQDGKAPFAEVVNLMGNAPEKIRRRRDVAKKIWEQAGKPCEQHEVWFDVPKLPSMEEAERMWISAPGLDKPVTLGEYIPIQEWVELYGTHRWQAHVFCPADVRDQINKAAIQVLLDEFKLKVKKLATLHAHIDKP